MPFVLIFIGLVLVASGVRNKTDELYTLVKGDIESGYVYWIVSILIVGAIGYIEDFKILSRAFMALILVVLFLKAGNPASGTGGFFAQFQAGLKATPQSNTATSASNFGLPTIGAIQ